MATQADPGLTELQRATSIYNDVGNAPVISGYQRQTSMPILERQLPQGIYGNMGTVGQTRQSQITRPTASGGYSGGGSYSAGVQQTYNPVKFNAPENLKLPEYKPPERDEGLTRQLRREYMGPGVNQIRRTTQEAIISSKSMDNPNARSLFIEKALAGVGQGIARVSATAGQEANREATQRYSEAMQKYNTGYKIMAEEAKAAYDSKWKQALMDFQERQYAARSNMNVGTSTGSSGEGVQPVQAVRMHGRYGGLTYV